MGIEEAKSKLPARRLPKFGLIHLLYATAVIGATVGLLDSIGLLIGGLVIGFWILVVLDANRNELTSLLAKGPFKFTKFLVVTGAFLLWAWLLGTVWFNANDAPNKLRSCRSNVRWIASAIQSYHSDNGHFPPAYIADADGQPMHSWRVLLLPYLEQQTLYNQYDFSEPWDGPNNRKLANNLTEQWTYHCPCCNQPVHLTSYKLVTGPGTAFESDSTKSHQDITDGSTMTLFLVEDRAAPVHWMEPSDLTVEQAIQVFDLNGETPNHPIQTASKFEVLTNGHVNVAFLDGSTQGFGLLETPEALKSFFLISDEPSGTSLIGDLPFVRPRTKTAPMIAALVLVIANIMLAILPAFWQRLNPIEVGPAGD